MSGKLPEVVDNMGRLKLAHWVYISSTPSVGETTDLSKVEKRITCSPSPLLLCTKGTHIKRYAQAITQNASMFVVAGVNWKLIG